MKELRKKRINTQHPIRIALVGKQRAGKSTVADYLREHYDFFKKPLAEPIYKLAAEYFGMTEKNRPLLINIGEKMREIDRDVWLKYMFTHSNNMRRVVVPDVRMKHEYDYLRDRGFIFIKVVADERVRTQREGYNPEAEASRTEKEVKEIPFDFTIFNSKTLDKLHNNIQWVMEDRLKI